MTLAAIDYPAEFPCLSPEGYSFQGDMGFVRTTGGVTLPMQRRSYDNLPIVIVGNLIIPHLQFFDWTWWVNDHIGLWVNFRLAHPFMDAGNQTEVAPAKIISGDLNKSYMPFGHIAVSLTLQLSPSVHAEEPTHFAELAAIQKAARKW